MGAPTRAAAGGQCPAGVACTQRGGHLELCAPTACPPQGRRHALTAAREPPGWELEAAEEKSGARSGAAAATEGIPRLQRAAHCTWRSATRCKKGTDGVCSVRKVLGGARRRIVGRCAEPSKLWPGPEGALGPHADSQRLGLVA